MDESQNGCFMKTKHVKFPEKRTFLTLRDAHVRVHIKQKCLFFGKFGVLCFLEIPVLRFVDLAYYRRCFSFDHFNPSMHCVPKSSDALQKSGARLAAFGARLVSDHFGMLCMKRLRIEIFK